MKQSSIIRAKERSKQRCVAVQTLGVLRHVAEILLHVPLYDGLHVLCIQFLEVRIAVNVVNLSVAATRVYCEVQDLTGRRREPLLPRLQTVPKPLDAEDVSGLAPEQ